MVVCLERGADLHMAQRMPLPLTVCCFSKILTGFTFLAPAHPCSPGKMAVKCVCVKEHFLFSYAELFGCDNSPNEGTITFSAKNGTIFPSPQK